MKTENQNLYPRRSLAGRVLTIVLLVFGVAATQNILQAESTEPAIESVTPESAAEGMEVTIVGENFGSSIRAIEGTSGVSFNGVWGQPSYWSETQIQVPVPAGAPSGLVTVMAGGEGSNGLAFVVERPAPLIEAVDSSFGPEGATVEISGRNFGPAMEASQGWSGVSFDGLWGVPTYWSDREIQVAAPAGVPGGLIVVRSGGQESNRSPFAMTGDKTASRVAVAASVSEGGGPAISKLKPDSGQAGTSVKLKGSGFGASQGTSTVTFNGKASSPSRWSDRKIRVPVPAGGATGLVVVTVDGKMSNGVEFTVTGTGGSGPAIKKLKPDTGEPGTWVKVKGSGFGPLQGTGTVTFNGVVATPDRWSDRKIRVQVPAGAATGPVVVTVDGKMSNGVEFTVAGEPPFITKLKPVSGLVGTVVKIKGSHFGASRAGSTVTFNGVIAEPTSWSDTKIKAPLPVGATTGPVVVTVNRQTSSGVEFTVTATPASD